MHSGESRLSAAHFDKLSPFRSGQFSVKPSLRHQAGQLRHSSIAPFEYKVVNRDLLSVTSSICAMSVKPCSSSKRKVIRQIYRPIPATMHPNDPTAGYCICLGDPGSGGDDQPIDLVHVSVFSGAEKGYKRQQFLKGESRYCKSLGNDDQRVPGTVPSTQGFSQQRNDSCFVTETMLNLLLAGRFMLTPGKCLTTGLACTEPIFSMELARTPELSSQGILTC